MKRSAPQARPSSRFLSRAFAMFFVLLTVVFLHYTGYGSGSFLSVPVQLTHSPTLVLAAFFSTVGIGYSMVILGLVKEMRNPSLDFSFRRDWIWLSAGAVLLAVVVLSSAYWFVAYGFTDWIPKHGLWAAVGECFAGNFATDTGILSLMFGTLFMTKSSPKKSKNYKLMLTGLVVWNIMGFMGYLVDIGVGAAPGLGLSASAPRYNNFLTYTIYQPWFWFDNTYQLVTLAGALWMLKDVTDVKRLALKSVAFYVVFVLAGLVLPMFLRSILA